jgi:serine/threonine protein kinase
MAPEVYKQNKYNSKADIWSLGVVLYEIFHKRNPFVND